MDSAASRLLVVGAVAVGAAAIWWFLRGPDPAPGSAASRGAVVPVPSAHRRDDLSREPVADHAETAGSDPDRAAATPRLDSTPQPEATERWGLEPLPGDLAPDQRALAVSTLDHALRRAQARGDAARERNDEKDRLAAELLVEQCMAAMRALASGSYMLVAENGESVRLDGTGQFWCMPCEHEGRIVDLVLVMLYEDNPRLVYARDAKRAAAKGR